MRSVILFDAIGVWFLFIFSRFNLKQFMRWFALRFGFLLNFVGFWFGSCLPLGFPKSIYIYFWFISSAN